MAEGAKSLATSGEGAASSLKERAATLVAGFVRAVDWMIGGAGAEDRARRRLFRSFALLHLVGAPCGLAVAAFLFAVDDQRHWIVASAAAGISLFAALPLLLRATARIELPAFLSVQLLVLASLAGGYHYGGFHSPFTVWLLVAVLLSFLFAGRIIAWCLGAAACQTALFFALLGVSTASPEHEAAAWNAVFAASAVAATLYISLIAGFYAWLKTESSQLSAALRQHQQTGRRVAAEIRDAEAANAGTTAFLANASHQLRTPLNVVIGYSELLIEDAEIEEREDSSRQLAQIVEASRALLAVVDEVVDLAEADDAGGEDPIAIAADAQPDAQPARRASPAGVVARLPSTILRSRLRRPICAGLVAGLLVLCLWFAAQGSAPAALAAALAGLGAGLLGARLLGTARGGTRAEPTRDELTGLRNRASFQSMLDRGIRRRSGETVAVLFADLDGFKEVNDSLGHDAGDQLLRQVAQRFLAETPSDVLLARLGGDEFGAAAFGEDAAERIHRLAEAMLDAVTDPIATDEDHLTVGLSVGIATGRTGAITSRELLRRSDVAMYRAKSDKRQPIQAFELHMDEALSFRRTMRKDLAVAIAEDQLHLLLQPVVGARTGELASAEALLRWTHPVLGAVSPAKLIPLAEESGQIIAIDDWVLEQALVYAAALGDVPIAVNISPVQFRHPGFARKIVDRLSAHGLPPHLLKLEITEGVLVTHTRAASRAVNELREAGIRIALDDFGTGFSSLSYLKDFQFDSLKIDRSFVTDLENGRQSAELLRAIIDLGHSLNMTVIAEGVETARQASLIQLLGCDFIQGYFTGRPMPFEALEAMKAGPQPQASPLVRS
ncbi:EAL domain-containing protein [Sphingomonas parva]|uniref:histidine kinase n=1 Tax=Sphingomonas parva TaxID=2555898 RepID=A0A4Y8ZLI8_9SPHN|nr:EAL domain-containing protein [Sphingomonas parva]TFI56871.1 EAL domain-containing protein [Sphingomonas parva]